MKDERIENIEGYPGYFITSCGRVWSYKTNKFLKPQRNGKGYLYVPLCKNGEKKNFYLHRLVAEAYIPNEQNLETVDHIDGCKEHNYINNLQWMTRGDNTKKSSNKAVYCIELNKVFESASEAARQTGLYHQNITACCRGERQTTGEYHWEYAKEGLK